MRYMNANITVLNRLRVSLVFFFFWGGGAKRLAYFSAFWLCRKLLMADIWRLGSEPSKLLIRNANAVLINIDSYEEDVI